MKSNSFTSSVLIALATFVAGLNLTGGTEATNQQSNAEMEWTRANPKMVWGETTNFVTGDPFSSSGNILKPLPTSLREGVNAKDGVIILSGQPLRAQFPVRFGVFTSSTNLLRAGLPSFDQAVILSMIDSNGIPVQKTLKGLALGQPLTLKPGTTFFRWAENNRNPWFACLNTAEYEPMTIGTGQEKYAGPCHFVVDPTQYFSIEKLGLYKLIVTLRLYVVDTNMYLKPITLPPVTVPVRVEKKSIGLCT